VSVTRGARVATAALLVISVLTSGDPAGAASRGSSWTRVDVRGEFGPRVYVSAIVHAKPGFVAVGGRRDPGQQTFTHPAVWTSSDGAHWEAARDPRFPRGRTLGFSGLAVRHGVLVAAVGIELWRSTDARTWRRVARLEQTGRGGASVTVGPRGFVALGPSSPGAIWNGPVSTSADGRHWSGAERRGTVAHPVGLFPEAQLGSRSLSVGPSINNAPPVLYASADGAHWTAVSASNVPERFGSPLADNRNHSRVLGIEYEPLPGGFGGHLWSSRDAQRWTEITSFHRQLPAANPRDIVQDGSRWVVGGTTRTADGKSRDSMWSSADLRHWHTMPDVLWGPKTFGGGVELTAGNGRVVGLGNTEHGPQLWVWTRPG
jgi:hypothetical protein